MDSKVYSRAVKYGFVIPEYKLAEKVRLEDQRRFEAELNQVTFNCPECGKEHSLNKDVLDRLFKQKAIGRTSFKIVCPETEVLLDVDLNARGKNNFSTLAYEIKKEDVKIKVLNLHKLIFESEDFGSLTIEQLNKIISYHKDRKTLHSENLMKKALEQLQLKELEAPKPQIENEETVKKKTDFLSKITNKLK